MKNKDLTIPVGYYKQLPKGLKIQYNRAPFTIKEVRGVAFGLMHRSFKATGNVFEDMLEVIVPYDTLREDFKNNILGKEVLIDKTIYTVKGIESFNRLNIHKGETVYFKI